MQPQREPSRNKPHGDGSDGKEDDKGQGCQNSMDGSVVCGRVDVEADAASEAPIRRAESTVIPRAESGYSVGGAITGRSAAELSCDSRCSC